MITGINYLRVFSVMITDWGTSFTDLQANDFGILCKNNSGIVLDGRCIAKGKAQTSPLFWRFLGGFQQLQTHNRICIAPFEQGENDTDQTLKTILTTPTPPYKQKI